jgi:hypothetical protein
MVTAQLPFEGDTLYSLMMQHMEGNVRPPHELAPELQIPESLSVVILKAIDKSREQRFQTAEDFTAALGQIASDDMGSQVANVAPSAFPQAPSWTTSLPQAPSSQASVPRSLQVSQVSAQPEPVRTANAVTPPPSTVLPQARPITAQRVAPQPAATSVKADQPPDSLFVKSAEQHLFLQPRKFRLKNLIVIVVLLIAAALVAGVGYLKYQSIQRMRIESGVTEKLSAAPSATLRGAGIRVFVSDMREVTLDGNVASQEDFTLAESLATSVPGVTHVNNRVRINPQVQTGGQTGSQTASPESLINRGNAFLDAGDYSSAIDCFTKAAADPNNKGARELLERARQAQQTEEKLLKNRRLP